MSPNVYRFLPIPLRTQDLSRIHGTDERIGVEAYAGLVRFYVQLLRNSAGKS